MEGANRNDKKQKEADQQFKKGQKAMKTGLLKWNPDHLGASLHFESAAKLYKELQDEQKAKESFVKYAISSEAIDSLACAADGYTQAAFLESNFTEAQKLLDKALELYMIEGKSERGVKNLKEYVKKELEAYEDANYQDPQKLQRIQAIYSKIYMMLYDNPDNMLFNVDLIDDYMNMLLQYEKLEEAIQAKDRFIKHLIDSKEIDHQIKRSYLEVFLLYVLLDEKFKLKGVVERFEQSYPNPFQQDEYQYIQQLLEALAPQNAANTDQDWTVVKQVLKKPLFSFLNNDIIKKVRKLTDEKIEEQDSLMQANLAYDEPQDNTEKDEGQQQKDEEEALNDLIL